MTTLEQAYDPKRNGFNALRLILAASVVVFHCFPLGGFALNEVANRPLGNAGVDGFFVLSGFLITSSWVRRPHLGRFLWHRALRILPAYWVCLVLTAFVIVPLALIGTDETDAYEPRNGARYVIQNAALKLRQVNVGETLQSVPFPRAWDGALYTLYWEALCYLLVAALGVCLLLRYRWTMVVVFAGAWALFVYRDLIAPDDTPISGNFVRFGLCFAAGAALFSMRHLVPSDRRLAALSAVLVLACYSTEHYRALYVVPFAYLVLWVGMYLPVNIPGRWDISYGVYIYGFVVQQALALHGVYERGYLVYLLASLAGTAVLAVASCKLVEQPALRLKDARFPRSGERAGAH